MFSTFYALIRGGVLAALVGLWDFLKVIADWAFLWVWAWMADVWSWLMESIPDNVLELFKNNAEIIANVFAGSALLNKFFPLVEGFAWVFLVIAAVSAIRLARWLVGAIPTLNLG